MKPENKDLIKALLEHADSLQEDILDETEQMLGTVPFILQVMARRPEFMIFSALKDFYALRPKSLDPKTAELLAIAAAASTGADRCLKVHMSAASARGRERGRDPGCRLHRRHHRPDKGPGLCAANFSGVRGQVERKVVESDSILMIELQQWS